MSTEVDRFELFQANCEFWIEELMMHDYKFDFAVMDDLDNECAAMSYVLDAHHAYMQLSADDQSDDMIEDSALHEVLEALLMPMKLQAINMGDVFHPYVQRETHAVIHRLTKVLNKYLLEEK